MVVTIYIAYEEVVCSWRLCLWLLGYELRNFQVADTRRTLSLEPKLIA